jgi:molybdopterin-guanine dinucleotide biosynthesis protein A
VFERVEGRRLIDLAAASLVDARTVTVLLGARERSELRAVDLPDGAEALPDDVPGRGPLGGLATVLARHPGDWVALLAADVPLVPRDWWARLAAAHRDGAVAIVPREASGRWEPLAALYHGMLADEAAAAVTSEDPERLALHPFLASLQASDRLVSVPTDTLPSGSLLNVNRPQDADAVAAILRSRRSAR